MTIDIPVWVLWTIYIVGGVFGLLVVGAVIMLAMLGLASAGAIGRGLNW
jgi:hypothetical protein